MASAERIFLLMDTTPETAVQTADSVLSGPLKQIRFEGVSLAYNAGERVLEDIHLTINAGETIAVVGATGSGKSSLVNLLVRFYDPTDGTIRFNGISSVSIPPDMLRKRIALVMQDPFLFSGSLKANLFFAANGLSARAQNAILEASHCRELVSRLPQGIDTLISEGGTSLSSGERQLISVARAFAVDPEVIILDEATSYVDSQTEIHLQQAIANLMRGRTCVVVAHRLTTARSADRIVVLNHGKMVETGSHASLMARQGYYHRLYQLQDS
jgi:ATP-binding cassette subfamily B protein